MQSAFVFIFCLFSLCNQCLTQETTTATKTTTSTTANRNCLASADCEFGCSIVNFNGCNYCQCPFGHPCTWALPPMGCTQWIPIYTSNGCVSSYNCTQTLGQSFSSVTNMFSRNPRGLFRSQATPEAYNWTQLEQISGCKGIGNCTSRGCSMEWRWFECPKCNCPPYVTTPLPLFFTSPPQ